MIQQDVHRARYHSRIKSRRLYYEDRNYQIYQAHLAGMSYRRLADIHNISHERVIKIFQAKQKEREALKEAQTKRLVVVP